MIRYHPVVGNAAGEDNRVQLSAHDSREIANVLGYTAAICLDKKGSLFITCI